MAKKKGKLSKLLKNKGLKNFLIRMGIFFIIYTFFALFHTKILYYYNYRPIILNQPWLIYLVYAVLLFFIYFRWDKVKKTPNYKNSIIQTLIFTAIGLTLLFLPVDYLEWYYNRNQIISYYFPFLIGNIFLFLAIFNYQFIKYFNDEAVVIALVLVSYLILNVLVEGYWQYFSKTIIVSLGWVLPLFTKDFSINSQNFSVRVGDFSVIVGAPCAGIYSVITFGLLFGLSLFFLSKSQNLNRFKATLAFLLGMLTVFIFNIIRVAIILLVGGFYSKDLAINLFHEYLSAIFLIVIFSAFLYLILPRLTIKKA